VDAIIRNTYRSRLLEKERVSVDQLVDCLRLFSLLLTVAADKV